MMFVWILVAFAIIGFVAWIGYSAFTPQTPPTGLQPTDRMKTMIREGIVYEDEFVNLYLKSLNDEQFMQFFGDKRDAAAKLLSTMVDESQKHKRALVHVLESLK